MANGADKIYNPSFAGIVIAHMHVTKDGHNYQDLVGMHFIIAWVS